MAGQVRFVSFIRFAFDLVVVRTDKSGFAEYQSLTDYDGELVEDRLGLGFAESATCAKKLGSLVPVLRVKEKRARLRVINSFLFIVDFT